MLNLVCSLFFPELSFWLASIERNDYPALTRHSFSYPALCEKSLVTPGLINDCNIICFTETKCDDGMTVTNKKD